MTIVLTGGGSGGHITPLLAVAAELKRRQPKARLIYVGQTGDSFGDIPASDPHIDAVHTIRAGKFRRYHGEGWRQLLDIPTLFLNARDLVYVLIGLWQSRRLLKRLKPDIIFIKGGFVGVPVGLAAARLHLPYITHDSDAVPGLANRIIARWAARHAVALPAEVYSYPPALTVSTGIPLRAGFKPVNSELKKRYRRELDLPIQGRVLLVVGGSLGAQRVNEAVAQVVPHLLGEFKDLRVVHLAGRVNAGDLADRYASHLRDTEYQRLKVLDYVDDVYRYSGAADLVVTRAGATALAEFALQGKACLVVPSPFLAGGHQLENARYLAGQGAAAVLDEAALLEDPTRLAKQVSDLLQHPEKRQELGRQLAAFAKPRATADLAKLILEQAGS